MLVGPWSQYSAQRPGMIFIFQDTLPMWWRLVALGEGVSSEETSKYQKKPTMNLHLCIKLPPTCWVLAARKQASFRWDLKIICEATGVGVCKTGSLWWKSAFGYHHVLRWSKINKYIDSIPGVIISNRLQDLEKTYKKCFYREVDEDTDDDYEPDFLKVSNETIHRRHFQPRVKGNDSIYPWWSMMHPQLKLIQYISKIWWQNSQHTWKRHISQIMRQQEKTEPTAKISSFRININFLIILTDQSHIARNFRINFLRLTGEPSPEFL